MNSHSIRRSLVMIVLLAGAGCQKQGGPVPDPKAPPNTLSDDEKATGWTLLFDGNTTAGWRNYGKSTISDGWTVQDGALTRTGAGGDIITTDAFKNFDLSIDWKIEIGGNSGVFYRASEDTDAIYWNAVEMQVLDDAKHPDGQNRITSAGAAYDLYPSPAGHVHAGGEWNSARLIVNGNHVEHWLNGFKLLEYELGSPDWNSKVAGSKFKPYPRFGKNAQGHIGLQDHGNVVAFRNIKIRVLP